MKSNSAETRGREGDAGSTAQDRSSEPSRPRRDPRKERAERTGSSRPHRTQGRPTPESEPQVVVIENPACFVLAVPELEGGRLSSHDRDVVGAARLLADEIGGAVVLVAIRPRNVALRDDAGSAGADRLLELLHDVPGGYVCDLAVSGIVSAIRRLEARYVVFPDGIGFGGDVGRRVASCLDERPAVAVQHLTATSVVQRSGCGTVDFHRPTPRILLVAEEAAEQVSNRRCEARALEPIDLNGEERIECLGRYAIEPSKVPLAEASFIISGGTGVKDWTSFHRLAEVLGASEGGSRAACDLNHLPRHRQIGASGTIVKSDCYLSFGISGAPQHLQGIAGCRRVITVNTDIHAEMIRRADLAIVADAQTVMPALIRLVEGEQLDP